MRLVVLLVEICVYGDIFQKPLQNYIVLQLIDSLYCMLSALSHFNFGHTLDNFQTFGNVQDFKIKLNIANNSGAKARAQSLIKKLGIRSWPDVKLFASFFVAANMSVSLKNIRCIHRYIHIAKIISKVIYYAPRIIVTYYIVVHFPWEYGTSFFVLYKRSKVLWVHGNTAFNRNEIIFIGYGYLILNKWAEA